MYSLIQSHTVTFPPLGNIFSCQVFNLSQSEQFTVPKDSVVGFYSRQALLLTEEKNVRTYRASGNQSSVTVRNQDEVDYNIAIRAHIGECINMNIVICINTCMTNLVK